MFNRKIISDLEWDVNRLLSYNKDQQKQILQLQADLEQLMGYLKLTFVDINERRVQAVIPKPEEL